MLNVKRDTAPLDRGSEEFRQLAHAQTDLHRAELAVQAPAFELADVEEVVDHVVQPVAGAPHRLQPVAVVLGDFRVGRSEHVLERSEDESQGSPELVTDGREKGPSGVIHRSEIASFAHLLLVRRHAEQRRRDRASDEAEEDAVGRVERPAGIESDDEDRAGDFGAFLQDRHDDAALQRVRPSAARETFDSLAEVAHEDRLSRMKRFDDWPDGRSRGRIRSGGRARVFVGRRRRE